VNSGWYRRRIRLSISPWYD